MTTQASNPGRVQIEYGHFLKSDLSNWVLLLITFVVAAAIGVFNWIGGLVALGIGAVVFVMSIQSAQTALSEGDTLPSIIVDPDRRLVATLADLSKTGRRRMAIKVFKLPFRGLSGVALKRGTKLAYIALFNGHQWNDYWNGFGGWFVQQGTSSKKAHQRAIQSIPDEDWQLLAKAISRLPEPIPVGQWQLSELGKDVRGASQILSTLIKVGGVMMIVFIGLMVLVSQLPKRLGRNPAAPQAPVLANGPVPGDAGNLEIRNQMVARNAANVPQHRLLEIEQIGPVGKGMKVQHLASPQQPEGVVETVYRNSTADVRWADGTFTQNVPIAALRPVSESADASVAETSTSDPKSSATNGGPKPFAPVGMRNSTETQGASMSDMMKFNHDVMRQILAEQRNVGKVLEFEIYGMRIGSVIGGKDNTYALASNIAAAAVHSGLLEHGEKGKVRITILGPQSGNVSEERNGVSSIPVAGGQPSYLIEKVE